MGIYDLFRLFQTKSVSFEKSTFPKGEGIWNLIFCYVFAIFLSQSKTNLKPSPALHEKFAINFRDGEGGVLRAKRRKRYDKHPFIFAFTSPIT